MTVDVAFEDKGPYLLVTLSGERDTARDQRDEMAPVWRRTFSECRASGHKRVLCDYAIRGPFDPMAGIANLLDARALGFTPAHRLAIVFHSNDAYEHIDAMEGVARREGLGIRVFLSSAKARDWLGAEI